MSSGRQKFCRACVDSNIISARCIKPADKGLGNAFLSLRRSTAGSQIQSHTYRGRSRERVAMMPACPTANIRNPVTNVPAFGMLLFRWVEDITNVLTMRTSRKGRYRGTL